MFDLNEQIARVKEWRPCDECAIDKFGGSRCGGWLEPIGTGDDEVFGWRRQSELPRWSSDRVISDYLLEEVVQKGWYVSESRYVTGIRMISGYWSGELERPESVSWVNFEDKGVCAIEENRCKMWLQVFDV